MKKVINPANKNLKKRIMDYIRTNNVSGTLNTQTIAKHLEVERSAVENTLNYMSHPEKGGRSLKDFSVQHPSRNTYLVYWTSVINDQKDPLEILLEAMATAEPIIRNMIEIRKSILR